MCGRARDFYTSLFSPDPTDPGACKVLWEELPTVSMGDRDRLELPVTLAEFSEALRRMPTNKSPGMDELTVEFYRAFWDILGPHLATVWAESLQGGVLPLSCRRAVLTLLLKKGDLRELRNWRPVSLLSTDYKILAKAISLQLGSVMADVIHPDQTYTEKAFDRVDHGYLLGTLQAFGFRPQFEQDCSGAELSPAAANILRGIVEHHSLVDVWHDHHPDDTSTFTFVRVEAHRSDHSQLDRIYLSRFHLSRAHSSNIQPAPFSDHHLATITASLRAERPGPAYWHFNNSLLEDEGFVTSFQEFWLAWREQRRAFPLAWRDLGKVRAKLFCCDYTWSTSRRRNEAIEQLEWEVLEMERHLAASPEDLFLCGACREKREELRALEDYRARGAFVQSRIRLLREMDCGSRFFYALEKMRRAKKHITCLLAENGTTLTDPVEMCGRACDFYTSLFSPDPTDPGACRVLWEELPMVSLGHRDRLELPVTLAEFSEALRHMPTNKFPGMDGLTVEFYRMFWDVLGPDLATVWDESLQGRVLPLSCR
ncbi:unnamed protein product [Caretta caretta]